MGPCSRSPGEDYVVRLDSISDAPSDGPLLRMLNVIGDCNRDALRCTPDAFQARLAPAMLPPIFNSLAIFIVPRDHHVSAASMDSSADNRVAAQGAG